MEVEQVPYIFGSFNRRKSSHAHLHSETSATNFDNKKIPDRPPTPNKPDVRGKHAHSKSQPETGSGACGAPKQQEDRALRTRSCNLSLNPRPEKNLSATCPICHHVFLEPRVLDCLHSFCTRCLLDLAEKNREIWLPKDEDLSPDSTTATDVNTHCAVDVNQIICPVCNERTCINRQGVLGLPPDYVVQHRLVLATLNDENTKLLCDLCSGDVVAVERCSQCLVNVCAVCSAVHRRHTRTAQHELLKLREVRRRGLMRIHRHLMCHIHPENELVAYCTTCEQTACPLCISHHHSSHRCLPCAPIAATQSQRLRRLLGRARGATARDQALRRRLAAARRAVQRRCRTVAEEIEKYMEEYKRVVEEHRGKLLSEVEVIRSNLLSHLSTVESSLSSRLQTSSTAINFTQALLEEGSDVELLNFVSKLLKKLEDLEQPVKIAEELKELLKQTSNRNSEHDGLVDFVPQNLVKDLELEKCTRNFDAFQRPIRHVLVDFVPFQEMKENKNKDNKEESRRSMSSNEDCSKSTRNSTNLQPIYEDPSKNTCNRNSSNIVEEKLNNSSLERKSSLKRKSLDHKLDDNGTKPLSGILNQLKNCLENHEDKKTLINNKSTKLETSKTFVTKIDNNISPKNSMNTPDSILHSRQSSSDTLAHSDCQETPIILEFLPQEAEIYPEKVVPVVFGQIQRLTITASVENNCCSASRPHRGGIPHKTKSCCGKLAENKVLPNNRKSDGSGKVYEITI